MEAVGIGFNRYGEIVVYDKARLGFSCDGTDGAGGFNPHGPGPVFHVQLEIAHTAIDRRLGAGLEACYGVGENQIEPEISLHSHALSHR